MPSRTLAASAFIAASLALVACPQKPSTFQPTTPRAKSAELPRAMTRARLPRSMNLWLPSSTSAPAPRRAPLLTITHTAILVGGEQVAKVKDGAVDPSLKKDGETSYFILPLYTALAKVTARAQRAAKAAKKTFEGLLSIAVDHRTPYRLFSEVLYTAGQAELGQYQILVDGGRGKRTAILSAAPRYGSSRHVVRKAPPSPKIKLRLNLAVVATTGGFTVTGTGFRFVTPGARQPRLTIPCKQTKKDKRCVLHAPTSLLGAWVDGYDYAALKKAVTPLKAKYPRERTVIFSAHRRVPLQVVVNTLDALRGRPAAGCPASGGCLFDRVVFSAH